MICLDPITDELIEATTREAEADADRVAAFLKEFGFGPSADRPIPFPAAFLLEMAAGLRLAAWEAGQLHVHRDHGLPDAVTAIRDAFALLNDPPVPGILGSDSIAGRVVALFAGRFAGHGRRDLGSDIVLDRLIDEDGWIDALAELLWAARHVADRAPNPTKGVDRG